MPTQNDFKNFLTDKIEEFKKYPTKREFLDAFQKLMERLKVVEQNLTGKIDTKTQQAIDDFTQLKKDCEKMMKDIEADNKSTFSNVKKWAIEKVNEIFIKSKINEKIAEIDIALANIKDGGEGPIGPTGPPGEPGSPDTPIEVRDKLETLEGDERLDKFAIRGITVSSSAPDNPKPYDIWIKC